MEAKQLGFRAIVEFDGLEFDDGIYRLEADQQLIRIKGLVDLPLYAVRSLRFSEGMVEVTLDHGSMKLKKVGMSYHALKRFLYGWWRERVAEALLARGRRAYEVNAYIEAKTPLGLGSDTGFAALYEDCLIAYLPGGVYKAPLSLLEKVEGRDLSLTLMGEDYMFKLSKLGFNLETLERLVLDAYQRLLSSASSIIKQYIPSISPVEISKISRLMVGGKPVEIGKLDRYKAWKELHRGIMEGPMSRTVDYILSRAIESYISIWRDLTGSYIAVLARLDGGTVLESASEEGHATYIFSPDVDPKVLGRALIYTGLRREPIFLPDDKLSRPENIRYYYSLRRLPYLKLLRQNFKGRVAHTKYESWRRRFEDMLKHRI